MGARLLLLTITSALVVTYVSGISCKHRVCYYSIYAQRRSEPGAKFGPSDINLDLCTHVIASHAEFTDTGIEPRVAKIEGSDLDLYEQLNDLKGRNRHLKTLLSLEVDRYDHGSFVRMTSKTSYIKKFAVHAVKFLRDRHFDGLDLKFLTARNKPVRKVMRQAISQVVRELRLAFDREDGSSNRLLLTVAVEGLKVFDNEHLDVGDISKNVEWMHLLAYDFAGYWDKVTGHQAALYPELDASGNATTYSVSGAVKLWNDQGVPSDKIVLGLSFIGRAFLLPTPDTGVGAKAQGIKMSKITFKWGTQAYIEICKRQKTRPSTHHYLSHIGATYLVSRPLWISYDDTNSLIQKVKYITEHGLGGFAASRIDCDDYNGQFCGAGPYPLLRTAVMECRS